MAIDKYDSIKALAGSLAPSWVKDSDEKMRIASYSVYEGMYWNIEQSFKLVDRQNNSNALLVPKPKTIVETLHRYLANDLKIVLDETFGEESQQMDGRLYLNDLLKRERFISKFSNAKRFGIIHGDWVFHIVANDELEQGSRISLHSVHPENVFKITDPDNADIVIGYDIAHYFSDGGKGFVKRLTYMKESGTSGPSEISVEEGIYDAREWGGPGMDRDKAVLERTTLPFKTLPSEITSLPIYHIRNFEEAGDPWGSSELRGFENILGSINQTMTDEHLTLALEGIGLYVTDAGQPLDPETDEPVAWNLGPGRVVEVPTESFFNRVSGVNSVTPMQDHFNALKGELDDAASQPSISKGNVDVQVAESGVALAIKFGPLVAHVGEKELTITDVMGNMLYDLRNWVKAYEKTSVLEQLRLKTEYGEKIPPNKQQQFDNIMFMAANKIIDGNTTRAMLRELGYRIPDDSTVTQTILSETKAMTEVQADIAGQRLDQELANQVEDE